MKKQSGLSLIEASIVLIIAASVSAGVLAYYNYAKETNNINESVKQIQVIASGVSQLSSNALTPIPSKDEDGQDALNNYVKAVADLKGIGVTKNSSGNLFFKLHNGYSVSIWRRTSVGVNKYQLEVYTKNASDCSKFASLNLGSIQWAATTVADYKNPDSGLSVTDVSSAIEACKNAEKSLGNSGSIHAINVRYSLQF
ncbi:TPA: prepilin-type N-terminal cleavage/methylation domain-containing protein [Escherichia coli]|nr:prepilin-type N-terminal cleavage/methylation domain-containing protein [Escherichia coli]